LRAGDPTVRAVLRHVLEATMRLLHPFAPFLSEELWQSLGGDGPACIVAQWPWPDQARVDADAERAFALVQEVVRAVRNLRVEAQLAERDEVAVTLVAADAGEQAVLSAATVYVAALARCREVTLGAGAPAGQALVAVVGTVDVYLSLAGLVDVAAERARLGKERDKALADLDVQRRKLANEGFVSKAPPAVVAQVRAREAELAETLARLEERLAGL
jgi:valyl-tRNA synthetase